VTSIGNSGKEKGLSRNEEGGDGTLGDRGGGVLGTWEKLAGYLRGRVSSRLSDTFRSVGYSSSGVSCSWRVSSRSFSAAGAGRGGADVK